MNTNAQYAAGIDSGSASTDAVILDRSGKICGWAIVPTGAGAATGAPPGTGTGPDDGRHCRKRPRFQGIHRLRARVPGR